MMETNAIALLDYSIAIAFVDTIRVARDWKEKGLAFFADSISHVLGVFTIFITQRFQFLILLSVFVYRKSPKVEGLTKMGLGVECCTNVINRKVFYHL